jgi:hypothetical protein
MVSKSVEICRALVSGWPILRLCSLFGGRLRAETYLPEFSFYRCPSTFGSWRCFLDSDGPITFDSRSGVRV